MHEYNSAPPISAPKFLDWSKIKFWGRHVSEFKPPRSKLIYGLDFILYCF